MTVQSTPRRSVAKQAAVARRLNAGCTQPAQHVLDATVLFENDGREVIEKIGRYYTVWYVRSSKFADRYYVVIWNTDRNAYECSCGAGCKTHRHTIAVSVLNKAKVDGSTEPVAVEAPVEPTDWQDNSEVIGSRAWYEQQTAPQREAKQAHDAEVQAELDELAQKVNAELGRTLVHRGFQAPESPFAESDESSWSTWASEEMAVA